MRKAFLGFKTQLLKRWKVSQNEHKKGKEGDQKQDKVLAKQGNCSRHNMLLNKDRNFKMFSFVN